MRLAQIATCWYHLGMSWTALLVGIGWVSFTWYYCVVFAQRALRATEVHEKRNSWWISGGLAVAGWAALILMVLEVGRKM